MLGRYFAKYIVISCYDMMLLFFLIVTLEDKRKYVLPLSLS